MLLVMNIPDNSTFTILDQEPRIIERSVVVAECENESCTDRVILPGPARQFAQDFGSAPGLTSIKVPNAVLNRALRCNCQRPRAFLEPAEVDADDTAQ